LIQTLCNLICNILLNLEPPLCYNTRFLSQGTFLEPREVPLCWECNILIIWCCIVAKINKMCTSKFLHFSIYFWSNKKKPPRIFFRTHERVCFNGSSRMYRRTIHRRVDSSQDRFIAGSIQRRSIHLRFNALQGRFITGSIHRWIKSSQVRFIAGSICRIVESSQSYVVTARHHWKASLTEIFLIEMYNFWFEHENWAHLNVISHLTPPDVTEKLILLNCRQNGSALNRPAINRAVMNRTRPRNKLV
jgi:hypothetical protein